MVSLNLAHPVHTYMKFITRCIVEYGSNQTIRRRQDVGLCRSPRLSWHCSDWCWKKTTTEVAERSTAFDTIDCRCDLLQNTDINSVAVKFGAKLNWHLCHFSVTSKPQYGRNWNRVSVACSTMTTSGFGRHLSPPYWIIEIRVPFCSHFNQVSLAALIATMKFLTLSLESPPPDRQTGRWNFISRHGAELNKINVQWSRTIS